MHVQLIRELSAVSVQREKKLIKKTGNINIQTESLGCTRTLFISRNLIAEMMEMFSIFQMHGSFLKRAF